MMPTRASRNGGAAASTSSTPRPTGHPASAAHRRREQRRQHQGDEERGDDEFGGGRQVRGDVAGHGLTGPQRTAQIAGEQPAEVPEVLREERVVEPEPLRVPRPPPGGRVGADICPGRIARRKLACSQKTTKDSTSRMTSGEPSRRSRNRSSSLPPHRHEAADTVSAEVGDQAQQQHRHARDARHPPLAEQLAQRRWRCPRRARARAPAVPDRGTTAPPAAG